MKITQILVEKNNGRQGGLKTNTFLCPKCLDEWKGSGTWELKCIGCGTPLVRGKEAIEIGWWLEEMSPSR